MALTVKTPPAEEPVTIDQLLDQLRSPDDAQEPLILSLGKTAREYGETRTCRAFVTQTWYLRLDAFPCGAIRLPKPPLAAVVSVKYVDTTGVQRTLAQSAYQVDASSEPARLAPAYGESWPDTREVPGAVLVEFTVGYGDATAVPETVKNAIKLKVQALYDGSAEAAATADALFDSVAFYGATDG